MDYKKKPHGMTDFGEQPPRRYFVDQAGRRVLIGLSLEETTEFETLDSLPALNESGNLVAWDEKRSPNDQTGKTLAGTLQQARPGLAAVDGGDQCSA